MLKVLSKLIKTPADSQDTMRSGLTISRQCDGERQDASLWREMALLSFEETQRPAA